MTTPDIAGLCERDMEYLREALAFQANIADAGGLITTARVCREAANTLERQADEINRLRLALVEAGMRIETCPGAYKSHVEIIVQKIRAAMTVEDTATLSLSGKTQTDDRTRGAG
jgi:hypothetical protein